MTADRPLKKGGVDGAWSDHYHEEYAAHAKTKGRLEMALHHIEKLTHRLVLDSEKDRARRWLEETR